MTEYKEVPHVWTAEEVADVLRVNLRTVYKMIRDGNLRAFRVRDQWRITESEVMRVMGLADE